MKRGPERKRGHRSVLFPATADQSCGLHPPHGFANTPRKKTIGSEVCTHASSGVHTEAERRKRAGVTPQPNHPPEGVCSAAYSGYSYALPAEPTIAEPPHQIRIPPLHDGANDRFSRHRPRSEWCPEATAGQVCCAFFHAIMSSRIRLRVSEGFRPIVRSRRSTQGTRRCTSSKSSL